MGEHSISARLEDCFNRQIELFKRMAAAGATLPKESDASEWEQARQLQEGFSRELNALEQEFQLLKREWDQSPDIKPAVREQMHEAAASVRKMADEIARTKTKDAAHIAQLAQEAREQWGTVQRGKRMLRNLRAGDPGDGGFIDRKA
ncbi:MAG TPA: hypothetical protein PKY01_00400 [Candidatus Hydrogenedentes bacterium]|nr:hypothetical protein [Candidatus Hydrogenedentota bacterium]HQH50851.1 hypothetical protein [Candidatus Hydrogenedentota bacterium]HQM50602.1 hypothetical protein [Candidatus Hydrogenedentota bacterium]